MTLVIWQLGYAVVIVALTAVFLVQVDLLPNWHQIWHYMKTSGFSFANFKAAFKEYMLQK